MSLIEHLLQQLRRIPLPDVVYHYTSPRGVLGMMTDGSLWATDVRYMNDAQEFEYTVNVATPFLRERSHAAAGTPEERLYPEFNRALEVAPQVHMYAASCSAGPVRVACRTGRVPVVALPTATSRDARAPRYSTSSHLLPTSSADHRGSAPLAPTGASSCERSSAVSCRCGY